MKYGELVTFEPLVSVIKIDKDNCSEEKKARNVKTYVFSKKMADILCNVVVPNLDTSGTMTEQKGLDIVGNYGTGKSHLMSVIGAVAENETLLDFVSNDSVKEAFKRFAGKYCVLHFELGRENKPLVDYVYDKIEEFLNRSGADFHFERESNDSYKAQIGKMMAVFEARFPNKHLLIIIDEMLEFLRARDDKGLNGDLRVLRSFGEACDGSRFKIIYGVQQLLYKDTNLLHALDTLEKVQDRFCDVIITKEDVSYVVENRLLKKNAIQKQRIREHLKKFSNLFDGINNDIERYVDMFPVHPRYIEKFEQIILKNDKREILMTLSEYFLAIRDKDVNDNEPGIITYDTYWEKLNISNVKSANENLDKVASLMKVIDEKIETHFKNPKTPALKGLAPIAHKIARVLAVNSLCAELSKHVGCDAFTIKEDICPVIKGFTTGDEITQWIEVIANEIVKSNQGQFVIKDGLSGEYYIRPDGGVNIDEVIKEEAEYIKAHSDKVDEYFYIFLKDALGITEDTYKTSANIWERDITWLSTKSFRRGYVCFGNPCDRSTTQPQQHFYVYFCPLREENKTLDKEDELYFDMKGFSNAFMDELILWAASYVKMMDASSELKKSFNAAQEDHKAAAKRLFRSDCKNLTKVIYKGDPHLISDYEVTWDEGALLISIFSNVASIVLDRHFNEKYPNYPKFNTLREPLTKANLLSAVRSALKKIIDYRAPNKTGQDILQGLRLIDNDALDVNKSPYTRYIIDALNTNGGKVLNRSDIIYLVDKCQDEPLYYNKDSALDYQLNFVALAAIVFEGKGELVLSGGLTLTASNINTELLRLQESDYYSFDYIKAPKEANIAAIRALFGAFGLPKPSGDLQKSGALAALVPYVTNKVKEVLRAISDVKAGVYCDSIKLLGGDEYDNILQSLESLKVLLDYIKGLDTYGKLKNYKYTEADAIKAAQSLKDIDRVAALKEIAQTFDPLVKYLKSAKNYVPLDSDILATINSALDDFNKNIESVCLIDALPDKQGALKRRLDGAIDSFTKYYCNMYSKAYLTFDEAKRLDAIKKSSKRLTCEALSGVDILNTSDYQNWKKKAFSLKAADATVTTDTIKNGDFPDFSPRVDICHHETIQHYEDALNDIYDAYCKSIKEIFSDPEASSNIEYLDECDKKAVNDFLSTGELDKNTAQRLAAALNRVTNGFDKITLDKDALLGVFDKALTKDEAKKAFADYLDAIMAGHDVAKVRLLLK